MATGSHGGGLRKRERQWERRRTREEEAAHVDHVTNSGRRRPTAPSFINRLFKDGIFHSAIQVAPSSLPLLYLRLLSVDFDL
ncbi:hypothetical protein GW17_00023211 [Ensete ventricosum]|nr:hypothetical protein GW17_00023211 [Ensete ventricosum]